mgnify:CR=1 FL=1
MERGWEAARLVKEIYPRSINRDVPVEAPETSHGETHKPLNLDVSRGHKLGFVPRANAGSEIRGTLELCRSALT